MKIFFGKSIFTDWNKYLEKYGIISNIDNYKIINYIVAKNNIKLIIPITINQHIYLNNHKSLICCKTLINSINTLLICNNKYEFSEYMNKNFSDNIPKTYNINNILLPAIIKPILTNSGKGCKLILTQKNIQNLNNNLSIKNKLNNNEYIIQEYIDDVDLYSGHFLIINGIIKFDKYYIEQFKGNFISKGKMNNYKKCIIDKSHRYVFEELFNKLKYNGFACADFKIKNNKLKIFEINPRLGGTIIYDNDLDELIKCLE
jgi:glutathione synthase/RimK-type ligase-like ATP-grasp enzyme